MLVLASGSPRRKELLRQIGVHDFEICPAVGEENPPAGAGPEETVGALASAKAAEVSWKYGPDDVIIAADTIVWSDGRILGKPHSRGEAAEMLKALSGKTHRVYTGVTVIRGEAAETGSEMTEVSFRQLTDGEIQAYIETGEPLDKAGAYGIQGLGALFVEGIKGDYFNVMGLPLCRLGKMLKKQGVILL